MNATRCSTFLGAAAGLSETGSHRLYIDNCAFGGNLHPTAQMRALAEEVRRRLDRGAESR